LFYIVISMCIEVANNVYQTAINIVINTN